MITLFAYLDAGTGSILLQAIMGGFAGLMVLSKYAWKSVLPKFAAHWKNEESFK